MRLLAIAGIIGIVGGAWFVVAHADEGHDESAVEKAEEAVAKAVQHIEVHFKHRLPTPTRIVIDADVACSYVGQELHCSARKPAAAAKDGQ